jgi:hypothetical protein
VESLSDTVAVQQAEAWPYTATGTGAAGKVYLDLAAGNAATSVLVGLYADSTGSPGALLATATIAGPVAGWNNANWSSNPSITAGTKYWIAVLATAGGQVVVVDHPTGGTCSPKVNAAPNNWTSLHNPFGATDAQVLSECPLSAYVTAAASGKIGDVNSDGSVNIFDLSILLTNYGKTTAQSSNPACDMNSDGTINIFDLSILLSHYGT